MSDNFSTIKEFTDEIYEKYSDNIAYRFFRDEVITDRTYRNLRNDVYALASSFVGNNYKAKHIAILGGTSYEWIVSFLAVIISGNVVIPIDKMLLKKEMMYLFEAGDVDVILYDEEFEETAEEAKKTIKKVKKIHCLSGEEYKGFLKTKEVEMPETNPARECEILFTSGTTGVSKGVMISQNNIVSNLKE
ncbi:MAG: long-chain fatty acid--CoA ligase, partial [Lachnospiraceae bacterium]|nr:long-chain fatty acid--CoA ligase [Lachnospiraceae bacterium]